MTQQDTSFWVMVVVTIAIVVSIVTCAVKMGDGFQNQCVESVLVTSRWSLKPEPMVCTGGSQLVVDQHDGSMVVYCRCPKEK